MAALHFYFDFVSPYAYFGWSWVREFCERHGLELVPEPTIFGVLLQHHGHLGPAEIPSKREFVFRDVLRTAARMGLRLGIPAEHPFNSLTALRLCLPEVSGAQQLSVIDALWRGTWQSGDDVGSPEGLAALLDRAGFEGEELVARARAADAKDALRSRMEVALERGVFGVPTFWIDGELFWGADQRASLEAFVGGDRGYDDEQLERFLAAPYGVRRRR